MRGCVEKPSSSLMTSMSAHSTAFTAQSGLGGATRRNVLFCQSRTVKRSLGNGVAVGSVLLKRTDTSAYAVAAKLATANASANRAAARACDMGCLRVVVVAPL